MMRTRNALRLLLIVLAGTLALPLVVSVVALRGPAAGARAADGPSVIATIRTGWGGRRPQASVAVNPNTNRIYMTNQSSNEVFVIDGASNTVVATVTVGAGPQGVAVNTSTNRIYAANSADDTVSVIEDTVPPTPTDTFAPVTLPPTGTAAEPGSAENSWWSAGAYAALAVGLAAVAAALGVRGWYARRRSHNARGK